MKKNKLSELTLDELKKEKTFLTKLLTGTAVVLTILGSIALYMFIKNNGSNVANVIPFCLLAISPAAIKLSQVNTEIKSRNTTKV